MEIVEVLKHLNGFETIIICALGLIALILLVSTTQSVNAGGFHWGRRVDGEIKALQLQITQLEEQIEELRSINREKELESRIQDEFSAVRMIASERKKRFVTSMVDLYRGVFSQAFHDMVLDSVERAKADLYIDIYAGNVRTGLREIIGKEMIRLIFENNFKPLPDESMTPEEYRKVNDAFYADANKRSSYLMSLSRNFNRSEWKFPFSREEYEKQYMPSSVETALREGGDYFKDVISARQISFGMIYAEYSDLFASEESCNAYIEKRFREIF